MSPDLSRSTDALSVTTATKECVPHYRWTQDAKLVGVCVKMTPSSRRDFLEVIEFASEVPS